MNIVNLKVRSHEPLAYDPNAKCIGLAYIQCTLTPEVAITTTYPMITACHLKNICKATVLHNLELVYVCVHFLFFCCKYIPGHGVAELAVSA